MSESREPGAVDPAGRLSADALLAELGWVRRLAQRLVGDAADDLTQEVATLALESGPRGGGLRAWLGSVTRRRAARLHRDRYRRAAIETESAELRTGEDPAVVVERLQQQKLLAEAVLDLTEPYRSVLVARFFDEQSPIEIATRRGVEPATVRQQVARGLARVRERLERAQGPDWRAKCALCIGPGIAVGRTAIVAGGAGIMAKKVFCGGLAIGLLAWATTALITPGDSGGIESVARRTGAEVATSVREPASSAGGNPPASTGERSTFRVAVVDERGTPLPDCVVFVARGTSVVSARSDATGVVAFAPSTGRASVLVLPPGCAPHWQREVAGAGLHTIRVPRGAVVEGLVEVRSPRSPRHGDGLVLSLSLPSRMVAEIPQPLREAAQRAGHSLATLRSTLDDARRFRFGGLSPDWSGALRLVPTSPFLFPDHPVWSVDTDRRGIWLDRPLAGLVLPLTCLPIVSGRVVWDDGQPVEGATVRLQAEFVEDEDSARVEVATGADGGFVVGVHERRELTRWLDPNLHMTHWQIGGMVEHPAAEPLDFEHDLERPSRDAVVPDLVLRRLPLRHFLVLDADGDPVVGAQFELGRSLKRPVDAPATDSSGRVALRCRPGDREFLISAPGYAVDAAKAEAGDGSAERPLRLRLRPATMLTVRLQGGRPADWLLELAGPQRCFARMGQATYPSALHAVAAGRSTTPGQRRYEDGGRAWVFEPDAHGRVVLAAVAADLPMTLRVTDRLGFRLLDQSVQLPAVGESRTLDLLVKSPMARLSGRVHRSGRPVAGATVQVLRGDRATRVESGGDGAFDFRVAPTGGRAHVVVDDPRFALLVREWSPEVAAEPIECALQRAHTLEVRVVDAAGGVLPAWIGPVVDPYASCLERVAAGHVRLRRVPAGPFTVRIRRRGRELRRTVDPSVVPRLDVVWPE